MLNKEAIMKLCSEISKKEGDGIVYSLGNKNGVLNIPHYMTYLLFDWSPIIKNWLLFYKNSGVLQGFWDIYMLIYYLDAYFRTSIFLT